MCRHKVSEVPSVCGLLIPVAALLGRCWSRALPADEAPVSMSERLGPFPRVPFGQVAGPEPGASAGSTSDFTNINKTRQLKAGPTLRRVLHMDGTGQTCGGLIPKGKTFIYWCS